MNFPSVADVSKLDTPHPDYAARIQAWREFGYLYEGGYAFKQYVSQFLRRNIKELFEVYQDRAGRVGYTSLLGNIIGWYQSAQFKTPPQLVKRPRNVKITGPNGVPDLPSDQSDWCDAFEGNCNRGGKGFIDFFQDGLESLLLYQAWYVLIDLPMPEDGPPPTSRMDQASRGLLDPYLCAYEPSSVLNWQTDEHGNLDWLVIKLTQQDQAFLQDSVTVDYWYYIDREQIALYERQQKASATPIDQQSKDQATLVPGYPRKHVFSGQNRVPVRKLEVPKGLWLANRAYLMLMNHMNLESALDFGLNKANLAQLLIKGQFDDQVKLSEVGWIHMADPAGDVKWLEPEGKSFKTSIERLDSIEERVYKACFLSAQAKTNRSTPTAQSGISKLADMLPARDVLTALGNILKAGMQGVYQDAIDVRGFDLEIDIRGFDFEDKLTAERIDALEKASILSINSTTFEREFQKEAARAALPDLNPETLTIIDSEIDTNPTPSEQAAQQAEEQQAKMLSGFNQQLSSVDNSGKSTSGLSA